MQTIETKSILPSIKIDIRISICVILVMIAFLDSFPVYASYTSVKLFLYGLKFLNLIAVFYLSRRNYLSNYLLAIAVLPLWWIYLDEESIFKSFQYFYSATLPLVTFCLLKKEEQFFVAKYYIKIFIFFIIVGLPIYILLNVLGSLPHMTIEREGGRSYDNYFFLYFTRWGIEKRFSAVFDEPGVIGTTAAVILFYYRKFLTKFQFFILLIGGILSFSLFFNLVVLPIIYFSKFREFTIGKRIARAILFFAVILMSYVAMVFIARATKEDKTLSIFVYYRFKWENNWIVGVVNNRDNVDGFEYIYTNFSQEKKLDYYIGRGKNYMNQRFGGSTLSYRVFILERGLLIVLYLAIIIISFHPWQKHFIFSGVSIVFLALLFFQRPMLAGIGYFLLVNVGLKLFYLQEKEIEVQ